MKKENFIFDKQQLLLRFLGIIILFFASIALLYGNDEQPSFYIKSIFSTGGRISGYICRDPRSGFFVFSEDRYIYNFYNNGDFRSRKRISGKPAPYHVQGLDGVVYKYFDNTALKAINMKGDILWNIKNEALPAFPPVVNSMGNIFTITNNKIISYSYLGRKRWEFETNTAGRNGGKIAGTSNISFSVPLFPVTGGIVYTGLSDGTVIAIDNYGKIVKTAKISDTEITALNINGNKIIVSDKNNNLFILGHQDLKIIRSIKLRSEAAHIISDKDAKIIAIVTETGNIELFDSTLFPFPVKIRGYGFTGTPLYFNNSFYFAKDNGFIIKLDINLKKIEEVPIPFESVHGLRKSADDINMTLAISSYKNMMIAGGLDWNLYFMEEKSYKDTQPDNSDSSIFIHTTAQTTDIIPDTKYLIYINELSLLEDIKSRENALDLLDKVFQEGITGNDERYILSILGRIVSSYGGKNLKPDSRVESNSIMRSKSAVLTGKIGTQESIKMLIDMLKIEPDPFTAAIIIKELGKLGSDPYGEVVKLFQIVYSRFSNDLNIAENIVLAIKNINSYQGYLLGNEAAQLLFKMLERSERRDLQLEIVDVLKSLDQ